jgi:hypothetical protein
LFGYDGIWQLKQSTGKDAPFEKFTLDGASIEVSVKSTADASSSSSLLSCKYGSSSAPDSLTISDAVSTNQKACPTYKLNLRIVKKSDTQIQLTQKSTTVDFDALYEKVVPATASAINNLSGDGLKTYFSDGKTLPLLTSIIGSSTQYYANGTYSSTAPSSGPYCSFFISPGSPVSLNPGQVLVVDGQAYLYNSTSISFSLKVKDATSSPYLSVTCYSNDSTPISGTQIAASLRGIVEFK